MRVAIVLVNWKQWRDTTECLESVFRLSHPDFSVVVCDNDSGNGSAERIAEWARSQSLDPVTLAPGEHRAETVDVALPRFSILETGANLGFAGGCNVGIEYALKDQGVRFVWLLNTDTVVDEAALSALVDSAASRSDAGIVGSKLLYHHDPETIQAIAGGRVSSWHGMTRHIGRGQRDEGQFDRPIEPQFVTGCSMLVRRELIEQIGPMDEHYFLYAEEVDWCLRAREAGWSMLYSPGSRIWHKEGGSTGKKNPVADYYSVRSTLMLVEKFYRRMLPVAVGYSFFRCLLPKVLSGQWSRAGAVVRAYRHFGGGSGRQEAPRPAAGKRSPIPASVEL